MRHGARPPSGACPRTLSKETKKHDKYHERPNPLHSYGIIDETIILSEVKRMKAFVDPDTCMGCGVCETIAPNVFKLGDEPHATVLVDVVAPEDEDAVREAVDSCPEQSIRIEE
jgi:ferredoxin